MAFPPMNCHWVYSYVDPLFTSRRPPNFLFHCCGPLASRYRPLGVPLGINDLQERLFNCLGVGSQLHVFNLETTEFLYKQTVFHGLRIHGIESNTSQSHLLLHAENEFLILKKTSDSFGSYKILQRVQLHDWILAAKWLEYNNLALVTMHNAVEFLNDDLLSLHSISCSTSCILYSATICYNNLRQCVVLSGTVFSEILIWRPYISPNVFHRLKGHDGVLFSIQYFNNYIVSTSDDRSVVVWAVKGSLSEHSSIINQALKLHGHNARVFRCKVLQGIILSAGEDGKVCCWNFAGELLKTWNVHQGGCVWSLDSDERRNVVVTGGSDGSILKFPLQFNDAARKLNIADYNETPKKLVLLRNQDIVLTTDSGLLLQYMQTDSKGINVLKAIGRFEEFANYSLLEVSSCRRKFAVAGYFGDIHVYKLNRNEILEECRFKIANRKRIFAIHWLSCNHFMSCGPEGEIYLWKIAKHNKESTLLLIGKYILPQCKERWTTAACKVSSIGLAVGDRKGNLHLFPINNLHPSQTIKKAHNHLGVTNLYWDHKTNLLYSLGRNSTLRTFCLNENAILVPLIADVLPFSWLAMKRLHESVLLGFRGQELVVWDCDNRLELFTTRCGGGHRSWDSHIHDFAYIRDKSIHTIRISKPVELASGTHSTEINVMRLLPTKRGFLLISGGEDTTMRIASFEDALPGAQFNNIATIKSHLSSIRCLLVVPHLSIDNVSIFSAGGRGQIIYWHLKLSPDDEFQHCKEVYSLYVPQDAEIRVMDLQTARMANQNYLFGACSDGCIKIYLIRAKSIELSHVLKYDLRCILKLSALTLSNATLLISMATDGLLCFWKFDEELGKTAAILKHKAHQSGINSCDFRMIAHDRFVFLSGGDDNQITLIVAEYKGENGTVNILAKYINNKSHCAQISGAYLSGSHLFTAGLDQKLLVFEYVYDSEKGLRVQYCASYTSTISDMKGMSIAERGSCYHIVLYGVGVEVIKCRA